MASPTLRSSSSTLPWPSCKSWATDRLALPSTAEMFTGTSNTGARSPADFSSVVVVANAAADSSGANSSRVRSVSSAMIGFQFRGHQRFGVQPFGGQSGLQGGADAGGGGLGIEGRAAIPPGQYEGPARHAGTGACEGLTGKADGLGSLFQGGLQLFEQIRRGVKQQARGGFHFPGQGGHDGLHRR